MNQAQEPKYEFEQSAEGPRLRNRRTMQAIPLDEPVFIFRARDVHAVDTLMHYAGRIVDGDRGHIEQVHQRIEDFIQFREQHPERMKEPD